jgi:hypothetical protein
MNGVDPFISFGRNFPSCRFISDLVKSAPDFVDMGGEAGLIERVNASETTSIHPSLYHLSISTSYACD